MDLRSKLLDASQRVLLYGTTPPRAGTPPEQIDAAADKLAARLAGLPLDGVVVYDIQDETGRTSRRARFRSSAPSIRATTPRASACPRSSTRRWARWTRRNGAPGCETRGSEVAVPFDRRAPGLGGALPAAAVARDPHRLRDVDGFIVGGVVIAERHDEQRSEAARLLAKGIEGCGYFISQAVYHAGADAAPAGRLPARLPRRRHRAQAHRPHLRALRAREDARLPALARRQRRAGNRARDPRRGEPAGEIDRDLPRQPAPHPRRRLRRPDPARRERRERLDQPRRDRRQRRAVPRAEGSAGRAMRRSLALLALAVLAALALELLGAAVDEAAREPAARRFVRRQPPSSRPIRTWCWSASTRRAWSAWRPTPGAFPGRARSTPR